MKTKMFVCLTTLTHTIDSKEWYEIRLSLIESTTKEKANEIAIAEYQQFENQTTKVKHEIHEVTLPKYHDFKEVAVHFLA